MPPAINIGCMLETRHVYSYRHNRYSSNDDEDRRFSIDYTAITELLGHQAHLEADLAQLKSKTQLDAEGAQSLESASNSAAHLRAFVNRVWDTIPPLERPSTRSALKVQKVFDTPELLEEILTYLETPEKLSVMHVQRSFRDSVLGSVELKKSLGLVPHQHGYYYSPFSN